MFEQFLVEFSRFEMLHIILIALMCLEANAVIFDCRYRYKDWLHMGDDVREIVRLIYSCDAMILQYGRDNRNLTEVMGEHIKGSKDNSVKLLNIEKQTYSKIPHGIISFFPHIEGFMMQDCNLKNISSSDLKPFSKLKYLSLVGNLLDSLENDLFIYTPKIEYVNLAWNMIQHLGTGVFNCLPVLKTLSLFRNICSSGEIWEGSKDKISEFKQKLAKSCKPTPWMIKLEEEQAMISIH